MRPSGRSAGLPPEALRFARAVNALQGLQSPIQRHQRDHFASRKLSIRDYLLAIAIFVNGAKGHSALR